MTNDSGFTPNGDLVLIQPLEVGEKTPGGIVLADAAITRHQKAVRVGTVVAFGEEAHAIGRFGARMKDIEVGDQVLFTRYAAEELPVRGKTYFILRSENVMGKITKLPDYELGAARSTLEVFGSAA